MVIILNNIMVRSYLNTNIQWTTQILNTKFWSMEDLIPKFIECFTALRSSDGEAISEASKMICELSSQKNAIEALTQIINSHEESFFRFQAANALKLSLSGYDKNSFNPEQIITTLLMHLSEENDLITQTFLTYIIGTKLINDKNINLIVEFSQSALESNDKKIIHSAVLLLNSSYDGNLKREDVNDEFIQFINQLTATAIEFKDVQITVDTLDLFFSFMNKFHDVPDEFSSKIWNDTIQLFTTLLEDQQHLLDVSKLIGDCIDFGSSYIDLTNLLPMCMEIINHEDLDDYIQNSVIYIIDSIITKQPELAIETNLVAPIFQKYVEIAIEEYTPDEPIDEFNFSIMNNICQEFSKDQDFVKSVWGTIQQFPQNDQGHYTSMMILGYLFNPDVELFYENFDEIAELITNSLPSESIATSEAAIRCLYNFIGTFSDIDRYIEIFEKALLEILKAKPSLLYIEALTEVMICSDNTDNIFEDLFPILCQSITSSSADANLTTIFTLSTLISRSYTGVLNHYEEAMNLLQELLGNDSQELQILKGKVVQCIIDLIRVSPENFKSSLESFIPLILQLLSSNDSDLVCSCLNCIGTINSLYPETLKSVVPDILNVTAEFAENDLSQKFTKLETLINEGFSNEEIKEMDDEIVIQKDTYKVSGGAFIVFASLLSKNPELIPENLSRATDLIRILSESKIEDSNEMACVGVEYLMEGLIEIEFEYDPKLMENIFLNLKYIIEKTESVPMVGKAIRAIAALIHATKLTPLGNQVTSLPLDIIGILTRNLKCFRNERIENSENLKEDELPECLYEPMHCLLLSLFEVLNEEDCNEFMKDIIPVIFELAEKQGSEKSFALDILINYAQNGFNPGDDFLPNLLNLAMDCCSHNYNSGFVAIEILTDIAPALLKENSDKLIELFGKQLSENKNQKNYQMMTDDCVSAIGSFAMNVLQEDFPLEQFGKVILSKMPPKKDYDTAVNCYNFLTWMIPLGIKYLKNDFVAAFARLFALPPSKFKAMNIRQQFFDTYKATFIKLLQITADAEKICSEAVDNDPEKCQLIQNVINS